MITGVNTLFNALLNDEDFLRLDFSRLHLAVAGGMALQRAVAERWKAVTGKPLIEGYGLTETSPIATTNPLTIEDYTGAIGLPVPSTDIAIRDLDGRDLPLGEAGELCIKGPQVMAGYWNRPDETAKVMTEDGYLRTGDIARVDERGYVYHRRPEEGHDHRLRLQRLSERDRGRGDDPSRRARGRRGRRARLKSGEAVKIVVVRKDESLTDAEIIAHCRQFLTGYKTPRHVEFRDTLPRTPIGKILRRELREKLEPGSEKQEAG